MAERTTGATQDHVGNASTISPQLALLPDDRSVGELRTDLWRVSVRELMDLYASRVTRVTPGAQRVLAVVHETAGRYIEQREIARRAGCGVGTVARVLHHLRELGVVASSSSVFIPSVGTATCQRHTLRGCEALLSVTETWRRSRLDGYRWLLRHGWARDAARELVRSRFWQARLEGAKCAAVFSQARLEGAKCAAVMLTEDQVSRRGAIADGSVELVGRPVTRLAEHKDSISETAPETPLAERGSWSPSESSTPDAPGQEERTRPVRWRRRSRRHTRVCEAIAEAAGRVNEADVSRTAGALLRLGAQHGWGERDVVTVYLEACSTAVSDAEERRVSRGPIRRRAPWAFGLARRVLERRPEPEYRGPWEAPPRPLPSLPPAYATWDLSAPPRELTDEDHAGLALVRAALNIQ